MLHLFNFYQRSHLEKPLQWPHPGPLIASILLHWVQKILGHLEMSFKYKKIQVSLTI